MRNPALAGFFAMVFIIMAHSPTTSAQAATSSTQKQQNNTLAVESIMAPDAELKPANKLDLSITLAATAEEADSETTPEPAPAPEPEEPQVVEHTVADGESLTKIAKKYETSWQRIFYKNTSIENPDTITPGTVLTIPHEDEELSAREIPVAAPEPTPQVRQTRTANSASTGTVMRRGSSAGNTYTYGYCTWYVKNRRPDLPNNLGNAITWASRAAAQGYATGSTPRVGAVGQQGNHVVYVESVNGDGTVTVSEMNFRGWNIQSSRTVSASNFTYIY